MPGRKAPEGGYDFSRKRHYRRNVYAGFKKTFTPSVAREMTHLLMPSKEGAEIENALQAGFSERNLIIVDRSPAIVAVLKRTYKEATAYGIDLLDTPARLAKEGRVLDSANLDMCSCICDNVIKIAFRFASFNIWDKELAIAITIQRGREMPDWTERIDSCGPRFQLQPMTTGFGLQGANSTGMIDPRLTTRDRGRLAMLWSALQGDGKAVPIMHRAEIYKSAKNTTMLWSAWTLINQAMMKKGVQ